MTRRALVVIDCGYGDAGKGTMIDALARATSAYAVVRFNGGAQALHHVEADDGRTHGFSQFGSGTFVPGVATYLSRFVLVSPTHLLEEGKRLRALDVSDAFERLAIDPEAPIVTPYHRAANWIHELARGEGRHGTCGMGIGEVMKDVVGGLDVLRAGDLLSARATALKLRLVRERKRGEVHEALDALSHDRKALPESVLEDDAVMVSFLETCKTIVNLGLVSDRSRLDDLLKKDGTILFEGAQGVLLDEQHGFHPHTTWSKTTCENALTLLAGSGPAERYAGEVRRFGVLRAYATRHGSGPMVTHDAEMTEALPELHNRNDGWQGRMRCGPLDLVATKYALRVVGGLCGLVVTCLDRVAHLDAIRVCDAYRYEGSASRVALEPFFRFEDERIVGIRPIWARDLDRQGKLTEHLKLCRPEYKTVARSEFLGFLENELGVPIVATSKGPRPSDKEFREGSNAWRI